MYDEDTPDNLWVNFGDEENPIPARGLILALNDASGSTMTWAADKVTYYTSDSGLTGFKGDNGYTICKTLKDNTACYAIQAAMSYSTSKSYYKDEVGWYLPSIGEWELIISSDGLGGESSVPVSNLPVNKTGDNTSTGICTSINGYLSNAGTGNYTEFSEKYYWSASEYNSAYVDVFHIRMSTNYSYLDFSSASVKSSDLETSHYYVRSVLAF